MTIRADLLSRFDLFLFDMDGTLILGDAPLPGAVAWIEAIRNAGKTIRFVTNNTLHEADFHADRLHRAGIAAAPDQILTPLPALYAYVREHGIRNAHVIAEDFVKEALAFDPALPPQAVILGLCRNWNYAQLQTACNLIAAGTPIVLCQPDPYCPDPDGNIPDSGALLALIETALVRKCDPVVLGKPSAKLIQPIFTATGIAPERTVFFGDRLKTDMALADACAMHGVLVLTGQTVRADVTPDLPYTILDDLTQIAA